MYFNGAPGCLVCWSGHNSSSASSQLLSRLLTSAESACCVHRTRALSRHGTRTVVGVPKLPLRFLHVTCCGCPSTLVRCARRGVISVTQGTACTCRTSFCSGRHRRRPKINLASGSEILKEVGSSCMRERLVLVARRRQAICLEAARVARVSELGYVGWLD